jgi:hypothetical protein
MKDIVWPFERLLNPVKLRNVPPWSKGTAAKQRMSRRRQGVELRFEEGLA